jgi:uncharacterized protein (DUF1330 family)
MSCYFIVSVRIEQPDSRAQYDAYIEQVKPIVERFGGEYLVRTEDIVPLSEQWKPDRIIVIRFPNREALDQCFASDQYRSHQGPERIPSTAGL